MLLSHGLDSTGAKLCLKETSETRGFAAILKLSNSVCKWWTAIVMFTPCQGTRFSSTLVKHITEIHPHKQKLYTYLGQKLSLFYKPPSPKNRFSVADECQGFLRMPGFARVSCWEDDIWHNFFFFEEIKLFWFKYKMKLLGDWACITTSRR